MHRIAILLFISVSACVETSDAVMPPPTEWGAAQKDMLKTLPLIGSNSLCRLTDNYASNSNTQAGAIIKNELSRRGLPKRDIEILQNPDAYLGSGMTYNGLKCAFNKELAYQEFFKAGEGHTWFVPTPIGKTVALNGGGKPENMKIYLWY